MYPTIAKWLRNLDSLKQGPEEPVDTYYSRFKKLVKRVEARAVLQDEQKLYYFRKGLCPTTLPILLTDNPNALARLLELARTYEQGTDFATNADPDPSNPNAAAYEKEIEELTKQMNQMSLNYASIASALSAQTEPTYRPKQPTQFYQKPRPTNNSRPNVVCYRCSEKGHFARDCMSERLPTKKQCYQMTNRNQNKQRIHYAAAEEDYTEEEEIYITHEPRPKPYNTNRKMQREAQKEIQKKSKSQKEIKLRNRAVYVEEPEFEDMVEEPIEPPKPAKPTRKRVPKLPSVID